MACEPWCSIARLPSVFREGAAHALSRTNRILRRLAVAREDNSIVELAGRRVACSRKCDCARFNGGHGGRHAPRACFGLRLARFAGGQVAFTVVLERERDKVRDARHALTLRASRGLCTKSCRLAWA